MADPLSPSAQQFAQDIGQATGLSPDVIEAWIVQEGADAPNGTGGFNYLNLRPYPGDPYSSVSSGNFEQFRDLRSAEQATLRRLRMPFARPIMQSAFRSPRQEIAAIASTGWDVAHYGGAGGPNLVSTYTNLRGSGGLDQPYYAKPTAAMRAGEGNAADFWSGRGGGVVIGGIAGAIAEAPLLSILASGTRGAGRGASTVARATGSATGAAATGLALSTLFSWRLLELIGGALLIVVGVVILGRGSMAAALGRAG